MLYQSQAILDLESTVAGRTCKLQTCYHSVIYEYATLLYFIVETCFVHAELNTIEPGSANLFRLKTGLVSITVVK